jgi:glycosyltransferase involved in cell wall biosynthesis
MAAKITQVLENPQLAQQLAKKGEQLVGTYSWERMARQTVEIFNQALS